MRSQRMQLLVCLTVFLSLANIAMAVNVELSCADAELVEGQPVHLLRYAEPVIPKVSDFELITDGRTKFSGGKCRFRVSQGTYRFDVLFTKKDGTVVALSTGKQGLSGDVKLTLTAGKPRPISLSYKGEAIPIVRTLFRVPGTMVLEEVKGASPRAVLSPGATFKARIIAMKKGTAPVHAVVWADLDGSKPTVEVTNSWHSVCKFKSLCTGKTTDAKATFFGSSG